MNLFNHPYHLVSLSPWPLLCSFSVLNLMIGVIVWFQGYSFYLLLTSYLCLFLVLYQWWRDVIREGSGGNHTIKVIFGFRLGMLLFILSEIMFFFSFFWSYFHMFLSPSVELGGIWPPQGLEVFNPYSVPLLNTMILLSSAVFLTWSHYCLQIMDYSMSKQSLQFCIYLGVLFIMFQCLEYSESYFCISDSVYGSVFFMLTGFHGLHVLIGLFFLIVCYLRLKYFHYSYYNYYSLEAASWYWHFVDVVWLFLYVVVYWLSY